MPGAAKRAALKTLPLIVKDVQQWKLEEICLLHPFEAAFGQEYWVYEVRFKGPSIKSESNPNGFTIKIINLMVLMNGKVIQPMLVNAK